MNTYPSYILQKINKCSINAREKAILFGEYLNKEILHKPLQVPAHDRVAEPQKTLGKLLVLWSALVGDLRTLVIPPGLTSIMVHSPGTQSPSPRYRESRTTPGTKLGRSRPDRERPKLGASVQSDQSKRPRSRGDSSGGMRRAMIGLTHCWNSESSEKESATMTTEEEKD